jgi:4-hydroxy-3-methylbut-2-en-1-yl diphosphate synthase IspG/GcpE
MGARRIGTTQAGSQIVRVSNTVKDQQQSGLFQAVEQTIKHVLRPHLARGHFSYCALMNPLDQLVDIVRQHSLDADTDTFGQVGECLRAGI